jgi:hypothetical protein
VARVVIGNPPNRFRTEAKKRGGKIRNKFSKQTKKDGEVARFVGGDLKNAKSQIDQKPNKSDFHRCTKVYTFRGKKILLRLNHFQKWKPNENKSDFSKSSTISSRRTKRFTGADDGSSTRNRNDAGSPEQTIETMGDRRTRCEEPRRRGGGKEERSEKNEDGERQLQTRRDEENKSRQLQTRRDEENKSRPHEANVS